MEWTGHFLHILIPFVEISQQFIGEFNSLHFVDVSYFIVHLYSKRSRETQVLYNYEIYKFFYIKNMHLFLLMMLSHGC